MPKNKFGGNRHKKMARKHAAPVQKKTRYSNDPDEIYACCNQIYGSGQVKVICPDQTEMLCFIRNKFRGRGKRDNIVKVGTWLLVGKRGFETTSKSRLRKCDLLEVYNDYDQNNLEQNVLDVDWSKFKYVGVVEDIVKDDGTVEFTDNIPEDDETPEIETKSDLLDELEEEIDIDDI